MSCGPNAENRDPVLLRGVLIVWLSIGLMVASVAMEPSPDLRLRDVAAKSGLAFRFDSGSRGKHDLPEIMGGGVALIDFDSDGDLDVYFCNGGPIGSIPTGLDPPCRLYRNEGNSRFKDVTSEANAKGPSYAMGAAVGDFDGDGRDDLFVTGWRDQRLYRNLGGGRFADVTDRAGLNSKLWSTSAAFADLDGDGDLDLYVCNYLDYDPAKAPYCAAPDGKQDYCGPESFDAQPDRLYRNNGNGTFTDVARASGITDPDGRGLGVIIADLTGDHRPDLFVTNDGTACRLYENRGGMAFHEVGAKAGVAFDGAGRALAGMGVAVGDLNDDGRVDLMATNFIGRSTIAFMNRGEGLFGDDSDAIGLAAATRSKLGFGLAVVDFDGDGELDMLQANGHVQDRARLGEAFAMSPTLLRGDRGRFVSEPEFLDRKVLGRGMAVGDLDGDGRPDAVVGVIDGPALVLRNESTGGRFATYEFVSAMGCPAVGASVRARIGDRALVVPLIAGGSYLSAPDRRVTIGLGRELRVDHLEVTWPSGRVERFRPRNGVGPERFREGLGSRL